MDKYHFGVSVETDKASGRILAAYLQVRRGRVAETREYADGNCFADFNPSGELLGIEVLGPCDVTVLDRIARKQPAVKRFLRDSLPLALTPSS